MYERQHVQLFTYKLSYTTQIMKTNRKGWLPRDYKRVHTLGFRNRG